MNNIADKSHLISNLSDSLSDSNLLSALETVISDYKKKKSLRFIPLDLFSNRKLGVLEVTVKWLKEDHNQSYHEIAILLNRDDRTIWTTYSKACKKHKDIFSIKNNNETVDIQIFSDRKAAPLKALVNHLRAKGMNFKQIAKLLNRDYKTIWTTYHG